MEQQFSLSWNNFHGNLTKGVAGLLGNGEFVDVTIAVEGHLLQAHKVILSICSPYFKKMFQINPCQHPIVVLQDVSHKAMKNLLQFMYHGEVSVKREDLTSFIGTAEVLQIKGLTNKETEGEPEKDQDLTKQSTDTTNNMPDTEYSDTYEQTTSDDPIQTVETELMKQKQFINKLHRLSNLKRKSEEFIQKTYYTDLLSSDKKPKMREKPIYSKSNNLLSNNSFDNIKNLCDKNPLDVSAALYKNTKDSPDKRKAQSSPDLNVEVKTEFGDMNDIIVTDPTVCSTPESFDNSREIKKDLALLPLDYQTPQDNCASLNALFMDLKNLVNGKVTNMVRTNAPEEFPRCNLEHRLVTIPQKEDGKKKYPQRSCRLCWKMGKRRDTRFMCSACALSLVKVNRTYDRQQLPVRYKYIYSRKGHKQLVHMNFVYTKHSTTHGKTSWRCVQYFSLNRCPATVETIDAMIYAINHQHNHDDSFDKLLRNNIYDMNVSPK